MFAINRNEVYRFPIFDCSPMVFWTTDNNNDDGQKNYYIFDLYMKLFTNETMMKSALQELIKMIARLSSITLMKLHIP